MAYTQFYEITPADAARPVLISFEGEDRFFEEFKELVRRGMNTWQLPPESMVRLSDALTRVENGEGNG